MSIGSRDCYLPRGSAITNRCAVIAGRLEKLRTDDGRCLPVHLKAQISRELDRLEIILVQLKAVDSERDALLAKGNEDQPPTPASLLVQLKGIGPEFAAVLWSE